MEKSVIIVDNSNVWIEGKKFSAKQKGVLPGTDGKCIDDPSWRIDFGQLLAVVAENTEISQAILVGSKPPQNDSVWEAAKSQGFQVIIHERNYLGKEKAVDTEIVVRGTEIVCTQEPSILKLLSGDRDFMPLISFANNKGWITEMWAFSNAFNDGGEMAQTVTRIKPLDNVFDKIGRYEFEWPIK